MSAPTQPSPNSKTELGTILSQSLGLYLTRFAVSFLSAALFLVPAWLIGLAIQWVAYRISWGGLVSPQAWIVGFWGVGGNAALSVAAGIPAWTAYALAAGFVSKVVAAQLAGRGSGLRQLQREMAPAVGRLAVGSLLFGVAASVGVVFLVIPGLAVLYLFCLVPQAIVLDNDSPLQAFVRAAGVALRVPGELVVVLVVAFVALLVAGMIGSSIAVAAALHGGALIGQAVAGGFSLLVAPWVGAALTLAYLKGRETPG